MCDDMTPVLFVCGQTVLCSLNCLLLRLIARQMLSVVTSHLINICHHSQSGGWDVSQLILISPSGVNYNEMFPPTRLYYLFIILKYKHVTEIFVSFIPLYSN